MEAHQGPGDARARLVSWNVRGSRLRDVAGIAEALAAMDADVVALQEIRAGQAADLGERLGHPTVRWLLKHRPWGPLFPRRAEGLAVLSRFTLLAEADACLTPRAGHNSHRRRVMQDVLLEGPAGTLRVVNVHLGGENAAARATQAQRAAALLGVGSARPDTSRTVLLGDLNTDDEAGVLGPLASVGLVDAPAGPTNPAGRATRRIDHALTGSGLAVVSVSTPRDGPRWAALSDHLPVVVEVRAV